MSIGLLLTSVPPVTENWPLLYRLCQDAAELRVQDIPRSYGGIVAVSQSGETRDVLKGTYY